MRTRGARGTSPLAAGAPRLPLLGPVYVPMQPAPTLRSEPPGPPCWTIGRPSGHPDQPTVRGGPSTGRVGTGGGHACNAWTLRHALVLMQGFQARMQTGGRQTEAPLGTASGRLAGFRARGWGDHTSAHAWHTQHTGSHAGRPVFQTNWMPEPESQQRTFQGCDHALHASRQECHVRLGMQAQVGPQPGSQPTRDLPVHDCQFLVTRRGPCKEL